MIQYQIFALKPTDFQLFLIHLLNKCFQSATGFQAYLILNIPFMDFLKEYSRGKKQDENSSFLERGFQIRLKCIGGVPCKLDKLPSVIQGFFFFLIWWETKFTFYLASTSVSPDLNLVFLRLCCFLLTVFIILFIKFLSLWDLWGRIKKNQLNYSGIDQKKCPTDTAIYAFILHL